MVAAVILIDALVGDKGLLRSIRARRQRDLVAADIRRVRHENARLREDARRLREDPEAVEEIARRDLGLIREGEILFIIRDASGPSRPTDRPQAPRRR
jgi:cell division protein FtsB